jgi:hypothetical protein
MTKQKLSEGSSKENEKIAAADGKSRGVLNDQTAGAQGDHHLIYFDQTARPLAQGGPSNIFVNQKASSAQGDHLFSRRTAADTRCTFLCLSCSVVLDT